MKICLINNLYKPFARGGAERIVELQAEGLIQAGHKVFIISTKPMFANRQSQIGNRKSAIANRQSYYLPGLYYNLNKIPKILRLPWHLIDMFDLGNYLKIKSILKKEKPDIVITHNLKGLSYLIPKVIKSLKIKHIHILHDIQLLYPSGLMLCQKEKQLDGFPAKIYIRLCRLLFNSPAVVISPSEWLMELHEKNNFFSQSKKIILPNPAPSFPLLVRKGARGEVRRAKAEVFRFLYVGQIEKHKGILFLIKSLSLLCQNFNRRDFELVIVGTGEKLKKAEQLAEPNKHIKFLGQKNKDEVRELMESADCLVVPSLCYENSPTVIYEAASAGLAVIAARLGGIPELIHELGGILFKAGNEGDLTRQMKWAMEHQEILRKIGEKGRKKIKKFWLEFYIKKLISNL
ncbi:MAG: glycosyltransferase family 4 protein [Patescibacteria group bacterium]|nr:glycosyltransferase family 4 protein [Patescibacteria group bacterium]